MDLSLQIPMLLAVAIPFAGAVAILATGQRLATFWSYAAAAGALVCTGLLFPAVSAGERPEFVLLSFGRGLDLVFRVDGLGLTFGLLASGLWVVTSVYSAGYAAATDLDNRVRYFTSFAASVGAAIGIAFAGNVLTFLLFYELLTLATYPLVAHKESEGAIRAGRRYLLYALSGGLAVTVAAAWTWAVAGTLEFTPGGFMHGRAGDTTLTAILALYIAGCGVKAAIMPMHAWLPAAMVAPTPVSALLHAVAVVKAGVFGCLRVLGFVFGPASLSGTVGPAVLVTATATTIVIGSLIALRQDNLKRRLAYSTIVHLSYIVLGGALIAPHGMVGAVLHMANHGLAKITLFFCAGAIYATAHVDRVSELKGLGRRMPWTFAAFTIGALGLVGVPGMCGFVGKLFLGRGAVESGEWIFLGVLLGGSVLTASYLLPIVGTAFFGTPDARAATDGGAVAADAPLAMRVPLLVTAALVIVFGLFPPALSAQYGLAAGVARAVFAGTGDGDVGAGAGTVTAPAVPAGTAATTGGSR